MAILRDVVFFTAKKRATGKISKIFAELRDEVKNVTKKSPVHFPERTDLQTGKLSKGENYQGLPYIILDFPKLFSKETVFAFRTMFWWGNYFSFHFHLSGTALELYKKNILTNISSLRSQNFFYCDSDSPWNYQFEDPDFIVLDDLLSEKKFGERIAQKNFFKISRKVDLSEWKNVPSIGAETFHQCLKLLQ